MLETRLAIARDSMTTFRNATLGISLAATRKYVVETFRGLLADDF